MNDNDMDKICAGCRSHEIYIEDPRKNIGCRGYSKGFVDCPCQHCLIKPMCDDVCDKYKEEWGIFCDAGYH